MGDRFEFEIEVKKPFVRRSHENVMDYPTRDQANESSQEFQFQPLDALQMSVDSKGNPKLILYSYRWVVLLLYCMSCLAAGICMMTCGTIASSVAYGFGVNSIMVQLCALCFYIMFVPGNFLSLFVLSKYGFKKCISVGGIILIFGCWLRLLVVWTNFYAVVLGSFIAAISQAFLQNPVAKMATTWFGDKERGIATAFGSMAMPLGCLISFILPNFFLTATQQDFKKDEFNIYLLVQTIIITVFSVPSIIFMREQPPSPPTILLRDSPAKMSLKECLKELFTNKNYIMLFITFNFIYGLYCAIAGVLSSFTDPYGYSSSDNSVICLVFLIAGILNSFFLGSLLDKYQCYRKALIFVCIGSFVTLSFSILGFPSGNVMTESAIMMFTGACLIPIVTIAFSLTAEITYPVPEAYSIGILISVAQIFGFSLGLGLSYICQVANPQWGVFVWVICALIASVFSFFVKQDLRRLQIDDVKHSEYIEEDEIRRFSMEQRSNLFNESNVILGEMSQDKIKFEFANDGGTGGFTNKINLNRSHDFTNTFSAHKKSMDSTGTVQVSNSQT